jgi:hypothetical protein
MRSRLFGRGWLLLCALWMGGCGGLACTRSTDCTGHLVCSDMGLCQEPTPKGDGDGGADNLDGGTAATDDAGDGP